MQTRSRIAVTAAFVLSVASTAELSAGTLPVQTATAPLRSSNNSILGCRALNLGSQPIEVTAELHSGGLPGVLESGTLEIPAGQSRQIVFSSTAIFGGYCIFEFDGNPSEVRGFVTLQDLGGSNTRQLHPAEPFALQRLTNHTTYTLPVRSSEGDNLLCVAQNLSPEPVQVMAELDNGQGTVVDDGNLTIEPGFALVVASSNAAIFGGYCRFSFDANSTELRGYITLQDAGGSNTRLLYPASRIVVPEPPTSPTPTETPVDGPTCPPAPTPEPCNGGGCCGDCNGNGVVQINELITAVGYALESCPAE